MGGGDAEPSAGGEGRQAVPRGPGDLRPGLVGVPERVLDAAEGAMEWFGGVVDRERQIGGQHEHGLVDPGVRGGEVEVGLHAGPGRGVDRFERRGEVTEAGERHGVDERLSSGEGRVEHRLGDAERAGEAAHRDVGPAAGLGEVAGGADDLVASQVEVRGGSW